MIVLMKGFGLTRDFTFASGSPALGKIDKLDCSASIIREDIVLNVEVFTFLNGDGMTGNAIDGIVRECGAIC